MNRIISEDEVKEVKYEVISHPLDQMSSILIFFLKKSIWDIIRPYESSKKTLIILENSLKVQRARSLS